MDTTAQSAVVIPPCVSHEVRIDRNRARQILLPETHAHVERREDRLFLKSATGNAIPIVAGPASLHGEARGLHAPRAARDDPQKLAQTSTLKWIGDLSPTSPADVRASLADAFSFRLADQDAGIAGLRRPQLGALHAVLGHWTIAKAPPATVVMPTGTGKTETMIALFAAAPITRLVVIVPSDALRSQIAEKFESLGVLQDAGVIERTALRPVVGQLRHKFATIDNARAFAAACNVIVSTPQALFSSDIEIRDALLSEFSHLFVDEAHHVEAATWRQIRDQFADRPVVQFTATPFREDGRQLTGRSIYTFPLRQAQAEGYFAPINYKSVSEFDEPDRVVAQQALAALRSDLEDGFDHILMARAKRIGRARDIQTLYSELARDLAPVLIHSSLTNAERLAALAAIRERSSRVVVCVDMLGEGFDLPSLKVAALHDPHMSLGVTLQFIGRFARASASRVGDATVVVGRPQGEYDENLRRLYAENADWNLLIRDLSAAAVGEQEAISDFEQAFGSLADNISLRSLAPKMSTIVFRTSCTTWSPHAIESLYGETELFSAPLGINEENHVAWFVLQSGAPVGWGDLETVADTTYDLYVLYWDDAHQLLYINSSNKASVHEALARAVCGEGTSRIYGEAVYRVMTGVQRLVPVNVGLLDVRNRSRRFSMHVGADVIEGFPIAEAQTKTKTNIFAHGFENGERVTIGAAVKKGRIWSYRIAPSLKHWTSWCDHIGEKLGDDTINIDEVMRNFIRPKSLDARPDLVPLSAEWPWEILLNTSEETVLSDGRQEWPLVDAELRITNFETSGPLVFDVVCPHWVAGYEAVIKDGITTYRATAQEINVISRKQQVPLSAFLKDNGLTFSFEKDATLVPPAILLMPDRDLPVFPDDRLHEIDWSGVDIKKESQGPDRDADSVQARTIKHLRDEQQWGVVIDDDGAGEIADVVAIRVEGEQLVVRLVHCKFSSGATPGARVRDLYEVCGQAQRSGRWRRNIQMFFRQLIRRQRSRSQRHGKAGFEVGSGQDLYELQDQSRLLRPRFEIFVAQPGLKKSEISSSQRELLAATDVFLRETAVASFDVLCSP